MNNVLKLIDNHIREAFQSFDNATEISDRFYYRGKIKSLSNLRKEILNEAVVCGSEENQTMCNMVDKCNADSKQLVKHCLTCNKEFDFFGKEITS